MQQNHANAYSNLEKGILTKLYFLVAWTKQNYAKMLFEIEPFLSLKWSAIKEIGVALSFSRVEVKSLKIPLMTKVSTHNEN